MTRPKSISLAQWLWLAKQHWSVSDLDGARFERVTDLSKFGSPFRKEKEAAWSRGAQQDLAWLLKDIPLKPSWQVVEIGCGVGRLMKPMASRVRKVFGVDFSPAMVKFAKEHLKRVPNVQVYQNDGLRLSMLLGGTINFCYSVITFQHIVFPEVVQGYFDEAKRVLRPQGWLRFQVLTTPFPGASRRSLPRDAPLNRLYSWEEIVRMLKRSGFLIVAMQQRHGSAFSWLWVTARKPSG